MTTFYFYDLETSGVNPKTARIMQFAGRRLNEDFELVGEPDDFYIKLTRDVLPEPDAILLTGITPQKTLQDGVTEAEFARYFQTEILKPNTIFVGFNNIRFDDEFMRYFMYRNFYDPYEWHWNNGCSRWDILDVVRMTRALRPDGINWPVGSDGKATNRLESLTASNKINHVDAHSALADVDATISVARLIRNAQPKLFDYLLSIRDKRSVKEMVTKGQPFAYVSGRYDTKYEKMTVAVLARELSDGSGALVFDLRQSPKEWSTKSDDQLREALDNYKDDKIDRLPFKVLQYNRCPSIAPYGVIDSFSEKRLAIDHKQIKNNFQLLKSSDALIDRVQKIFEEKKKSFQTSLVPDESDPDAKLYDGFFSDSDKLAAKQVAKADSESLMTLKPNFSDGRLSGLFPLYKARNYPKSLNESERNSWESHVEQKLFKGSPSQMDKFINSLMQIAARPGLTANQTYLVEELKLYAESITPAD